MDEQYRMEEDVALIQAVHSHPILYTPRSCSSGTLAEYKESREQAWKQVAQETENTVARCKTRFKTMRDSNNRFKKRGLANKDFTNCYKYSSYLTFLDESQPKRVKTDQPVERVEDEDVDVDVCNLLIMKESAAERGVTFIEINDEESASAQDEAEETEEATYNIPPPALQMRPVYSVQLEDQSTQVHHSSKPEADDEDASTNALLVYMGKVLKSLPYDIRMEAKNRLIQDLHHYEEVYLRNKANGIVYENFPNMVSSLKK